MATLNANVSASQKWLPLANAENVQAGLYTVDSENVELVGLHLDSTRTDARVDGRWVKRGVAGSTKASHTSGATLTRYYPDAPGGTGGGASVLQVGTPVVIVDSDIKTLPTVTLPEIIPAPGSNKIAFPMMIVIRTDFSVAYSGIDADGSDLSFYWDDGNSSVQWSNRITNSADSSISDLTTLLTTTTPRNVLLTPMKTVRLNDPPVGNQEIRQPNNDEPVMVDTHLILYVTNGDVFGGGDPANTMTIIPYYVVLDV